MSKVTPKNEEATIESLYIEKAVSGDARAFGSLYDMHVEQVHRHIYYRVCNRADTEDLTQQVFVKAWKALPSYQKKSRPFIAWLLTISNNLVIDFYRKNKNNNTADIDGFAHSLKNHGEPSPEQAAEADFNKKKIWAAIRQLPQNQQQLIVLRFMDGYRNPEIAAMVGNSEGSVRVSIHRALTKLRQIMQREEGI